MKKYISGLITGVVLSMSLMGFAAVKLNVVPNPYPVLINGSESKIEGYNINGSTYIGLKDAAESLDVDVKFDNNKKTIEITRGKGAVNATTLPSDSSKIERTPDGLQVSYFDGKPYVKGVRIHNKYTNHTTLKTKYTVYYDDKTNKLFFLSETDSKNKTVLIDDVPFRKFENDVICIEYDYYLNKILPLIK